MYLFQFFVIVLFGVFILGVITQIVIPSIKKTVLFPILHKNDYEDAYWIARADTVRKEGYASKEEVRKTFNDLDFS